MCEVIRDAAGFGGRERLTCKTHDATLVHQPWMGDVWNVFMRDFLKEHPPTSGNTHHLTCDEQATVPFPQCYCCCSPVAHFGASECESLCPQKFDEAGKPFTHIVPAEA